MKFEQYWRVQAKEWIRQNVGGCRKEENCIEATDSKDEGRVFTVDWGK